MVLISNDAAPELTTPHKIGESLIVRPAKANKINLKILAQFQVFCYQPNELKPKKWELATDELLYAFAVKNLDTKSKHKLLLYTKKGELFWETAIDITSKLEKVKKKKRFVSISSGTTMDLRGVTFLTKEDEKLFIEKMEELYRGGGDDNFTTAFDELAVASSPKDKRNSKRVSSAQYDKSSLKNTNENADLEHKLSESKSSILLSCDNESETLGNTPPSKPKRGDRSSTLTKIDVPPELINNEGKKNKTTSAQPPPARPQRSRMSMIAGGRSVSNRTSAVVASAATATVETSATIKESNEDIPKKKPSNNVPTREELCEKMASTEQAGSLSKSSEALSITDLMDIVELEKKPGFCHSKTDLQLNPLTASYFSLSSPKLGELFTDWLENIEDKQIQLQQQKLSTPNINLPPIPTPEENKIDNSVTKTEQVQIRRRSKTQQLEEQMEKQLKMIQHSKQQFKSMQDLAQDEADHKITQNLSQNKPQIEDAKEKETGFLNVEVDMKEKEDELKSPSAPPPPPPPAPPAPPAPTTAKSSNIVVKKHPLVTVTNDDKKSEQDNEPPNQEVKSPLIKFFNSGDLRGAATNLKRVQSDEINENSGQINDPILNSLMARAKNMQMSCSDIDESDDDDW